MNFTSLTDARIDSERSKRTCSEAEAGSCFWNVGQQRADGAGHLDRVGPGLLEDRRGDRALVDEPGGGLVVLDAVDDAAEVVEAHGRAVAVGDDDRPVGGRLRQLAGGLDGEGRHRAVEDAGGEVDVGALDGRAHLVDADAAGGERPRVELDAHRVLLRAEDLDLGHAGDRRDPLRHHRLAVLVELRERQRRRGQREVEDRLVGRVDLLVRGRARHVGRQLPRRGRDRRLHVLGGGVEVAAQVELQGDRGRALHARSSSSSRARRSSRTAARAASRRRRPSSPGWRPGREAETWIVGKSTLGRSLDRQHAVAHDAEEQDADHDERRHDRTADEELGDVHDGSPLGRLDLHLRPGRQAQLAVGDDPLPRLQALAPRSAACPGSALTVTGPRLDGQVLLDDEDERALLAGLDRLRRDDDGVRLGREHEARRSRTGRARGPGPALGNVAFNRIVPVAAFTALSRNVSSPFASCAGVVRWGRASPRAAVRPAMCCLIAASEVSGTANDTYTGWIWLMTTSGLSSLAFTTLPAWTSRLPVRPRDRRRIVQ